MIIASSVDERTTHQEAAKARKETARVKKKNSASAEYKPPSNVLCKSSVMCDTLLSGVDVLITRNMTEGKRNE